MTNSSNEIECAENLMESENNEPPTDDTYILTELDKITKEIK